MHNAAGKLSIVNFDASCSLFKLPNSLQKDYLIRYLSDLGASSVLEEASYFDRDYLSEFSSFYSISSAGYPNVCKRVHFFSTNIDRSIIRKATGGNEKSIDKLQRNYLGFIVIRPIPATPFGRTVLSWYPDINISTPRVVSPSRNYYVHIAGIELSVFGLAWQQQDSGVGACATVGLWSMLHSSAFDDRHAIPTTAEITQSAHRNASMGARVFPSTGLTIEQICESIKEHGLSPIVFRGDIITPNGECFFSRQRFASSCAAFIRSGYPVLLCGQLGNDGLHAVCTIGFRSCAPSAIPNGEHVLQDSNIPNIYIHDDNIGPNVRFSVLEQTNGIVQLKPDSPPSLTTPPLGDPIANYPEITPHLMVVAAHNDLRTSPDKLHEVGIENVHILTGLMNSVYSSIGVTGIGLAVSARYIDISDYLGAELNSLLKSKPRVLSGVRLGLSERVRPMCLHLGVIRIGREDSTPLLDILYDTTDSERNHPVFACVYFSTQVKPFIDALNEKTHFDFGIPIKAC